MARKLVLCLQANQAPDLRRLQAHIQSLGFKLTVDEAYAPFASDGYLPCTVEGEDSGVDLRWARDAALPEAAQALEAQRGDRKDLARLSWAGDPREEISALVMAAAMAQLAEALLVDPDKGLVLAPEALLKKAKVLVADSF